MTISRTLAVIAAFLMVGSFAAATLGPQDLSLGDLLASWNGGKLVSAEQFIRSHFSNWWWERPVLSVLARPVWIIPAMLGLVVAGGALTVSNSRKSTPSRRRRS